MRNKLTCNLSGRLGNNLFQLASCISISQDYDLELFVNKKTPGVYHEYKNNVLQHIKFLDINIDDYINIGISHNYQQIQIPKNQNMILNGYGQTDKYFRHHRELIISMFGPSQSFVKDNQNIIPSPNTTAINVRRGDYLYYPNHHPVLSSEYINHYAKTIHSDYYLVCSDDIEWCKNNINLPNTIFIENKKPWEVLWILSMCKNFIISNSTFSWWAAYLSTSCGKVLMPSVWFGPEYQYMSTADIPCDGWIVAPSRFEDGQIKL